MIPLLIIMKVEGVIHNAALWETFKLCGGDYNAALWENSMLLGER